MADFETDYDRNGRYAGDREARTAIGEPYELKGPTIEAAFAGSGGFDANPTADRWGSWVSAYWPLHAADGRVEAVLGVDYAAADWAHEINRARRGAMVISDSPHHLPARRTRRAMRPRARVGSKANSLPA